MRALQSFARTDEQLLRELGSREFTATTAVVAVVIESLLTVAHLGDSRAAIGCPGSSARFLTHDHKPDGAEELKRIREVTTRFFLRG
jgi:serine/threonine protein phosphatase PrpC